MFVLFGVGCDAFSIKNKGSAGVVWQFPDTGNYWQAPNLGDFGWRGGGLVTNITTTDTDDAPFLLQAEMAQPEKCVRLSCGDGVSTIWYRVEDGWYGCNYVREHHSSSSSLDIIPKIRSSDLVQVHDALLLNKKSLATSMTNDNNNWPTPSHLIWAKWFAQSLDHTVLTRGMWQLAPLGSRRHGHYDANVVQRIVDQPFESGHFSFDRWTFPAWTLRPMSHPESGRVKWWRKQIVRANEETSSSLPPVLVWFFSGLDGYVVLDGHDRLLAASLEGKGVNVLCLRQVDFMEEDNPMRRAFAFRDEEYLKRCCSGSRALWRFPIGDC